jgi:ParB-like chromosome segregation protein Spo0J
VKRPALSEWPADQVERRPIADLIPYARNARTHSDAQIAQIAASIREWGWTVPVLVDGDGELIAGHGRVLAARQLGIETVPVMTAIGWSEAKIRAYRLADNKLALNSGWDEELLALELADLRELGAALDLTGFDAASIESLLAGPKAPDGFDEYDENIETEHECPKCGYKWSGGGHATRKAADDEAP